MSDDTITNQWQANIEGEWWGVPSVFDAEGNHTGWIKVNRSSVVEGDATIYYMHTLLDSTGPLRNRLETTEFAFEVTDNGRSRIYMGPDFVGAGHPYGTLVDAHYYSPTWRADLRTMVHILDDNETQIYSSQLFDGHTIVAVFNGVYKVAFDYETNEATRERIDAFCAAERPAGPHPHDIPAKTAGEWTGTMHCWGPDQEPEGTVEVRITHTPINTLRATQTIELSGVVNRSLTFDRYHESNRHTYEGPDVFGNGFAYGRALYTTQHVYGEATKIAGREFLYDDQLSMSAVWKWSEDDRLSHVMYGSLAWTEG